MSKPCECNVPAGTVQPGSYLDNISRCRCGIYSCPDKESDSSFYEEEDFLKACEQEEFDRVTKNWVAAGSSTVSNHEEEGYTTYLFNENGDWELVSRPLSLDGTYNIEFTSTISFGEFEEEILIEKNSGFTLVKAFLQKIIGKIWSFISKYTFKRITKSKAFRKNMEL